MSRWAKLSLVAIVWALCLAAGLALGGDVADALADRAQFSAEDWPDLYYLSLSSVADESARADLVAALRLMVASSSHEPVLERCLPVEVSSTLLRLNLASLRWGRPAWRRLVARYPYAESSNPLVLRGDWFLVELSDTTESRAYYELLFPGAETTDEALAIAGVDSAERFRLGLVEGASTVNVNGIRWVENRPLPRGYAWLTRDAKKITAATDPLEHPDGKFKHDGEEIILGLRKFSRATGESGVLQAYFLADGDSRLVDRAPVDLVVDNTGFRGLPEIRAPGSCVQCHETGLNPFRRNEVREYVADGVELYADESVERFHFGDLDVELLRNNSDYQAIVRLATGLESAAATKAFRRAIDRYDENVTAGVAAHELRVEPIEFSRAVAYADEKGIESGARLSGLAHGKPVPRTTFEEVYLQAKAAINLWGSR